MPRRGTPWDWCRPPSNRVWPEKRKRGDGKSKKNRTALCVVFWGNTVLPDRLLKLKKAKNYVGCYTVSKRGWYVYVDL